MEAIATTSPERGAGGLERLRSWTYAFVEADVEGGRAYDLTIIWLICLNALAMILETVKPASAAYGGFFRSFEIFTVAVFTADYLLRLWACTLRTGFEGALRGRLRFALTPMALVDLVSVLPFFLPLLGVDVRLVRAMRTLRLLRLVKLTRYSHALQMVGRVLRSKGEELLTTFLLGGVLLLISSSLMYFAEGEAQPDKFSSIPATMWWGIVTLTTVGYGDVFPVTTMGKLLSAVISVLGIGIVALPTGILGAAFVEEMQARKERERTGHDVPAVLCTRCGTEVESQAATHPHEAG
ncbi:MAG TPA: ion transporter [Longimicrobiaceae bacterium]|jgi:voltage-gated potassium channel|nr:ion transporter [Longimicrobiaceae bacterium]